MQYILSLKAIDGCLSVGGKAGPVTIHDRK